MTEKPKIHPSHGIAHCLDCHAPIHTTDTVLVCTDCGGLNRKAYCRYPDCTCPFDDPGTKDWCALNLPHKR